MTDIRSRLEAALIEHTFVQGDDEQPGGCTGSSCTWHGWFLGDWRRHVADAVLSLPGIAIVELPEPVQFDPAHDCVGRWRVGEYGAVIAYSDGYMIDETGREVGPPLIAREYAAALLAAAVQAQEPK